MTHALEIRLLSGSFALARLPRGMAIPAMADEPFSAVVVSEHGVTLVCREDIIPVGAESSTGFRCLTVDSVFDLESIGIVAAITQPLARASISLFAFSTWETDYILVHERDADLAVKVLSIAGHRVSGAWAPSGAVNPGSTAGPSDSH